MKEEQPNGNSSTQIPWNDGRNCSRRSKSPLGQSCGARCDPRSRPKHPAFGKYRPAVHHVVARRRAGHAGTRNRQRARKQCDQTKFHDDPPLMSTITPLFDGRYPIRQGNLDGELAPGMSGLQLVDFQRAAPQRFRLADRKRTLGNSATGRFSPLGQRPKLAIPKPAWSPSARNGIRPGDGSRCNREPRPDPTKKSPTPQPPYVRF